MRLDDELDKSWTEWRLEVKLLSGLIEVMREVRSTNMTSLPYKKTIEIVSYIVHFTRKSIPIFHPTSNNVTGNFIKDETHHILQVKRQNKFITLCTFDLRVR